MAVYVSADTCISKYTHTYASVCVLLSSGMVLLIMLLCDSICVSRYVDTHIRMRVCVCCFLLVSAGMMLLILLLCSSICVSRYDICTYTHTYANVWLLLSSGMMLLVLLLCGSMRVSIYTYMYIHTHVCMCVCCCLLV